MEVGGLEKLTEHQPHAIFISVIIKALDHSIAGNIQNCLWVFSSVTDSKEGRFADEAIYKYIYSLLLDFFFHGGL